MNGKIILYFPNWLVIGKPELTFLNCVGDNVNALGAVLSNASRQGR